MVFNPDRDPMPPEERTKVTPKVFNVSPLRETTKHAYLYDPSRHNIPEYTVTARRPRNNEHDAVENPPRQGQLARDPHRIELRIQDYGTQVLTPADAEALARDLFSLAAWAQEPYAETENKPEPDLADVHPNMTAEEEDELYSPLTKAQWAHARKKFERERAEEDQMMHGQLTTAQWQYARHKLELEYKLQRQRELKDYSKRNFETKTEQEAFHYIRSLLLGYDLIEPMSSIRANDAVQIAGQVIDLLRKHTLLAAPSMPPRIIHASKPPMGKKKVLPKEKQNLKGKKKY